MTRSTMLLRALLAFIGLCILFLGLDVVFGGIRTSGWMGPTDFVDVISPADFNAQDNHVRFLGGVFTSFGLVFLTGAFLFHSLRITMIVLCSIVFLGGLSRFTTPDLATLLNMAVLPSVLLELFLFPALAVWIFKAGRHHGP